MGVLGAGLIRGRDCRRLKTHSHRLFLLEKRRLGAGFQAGEQLLRQHLRRGHEGQNGGSEGWGEVKR